MRSPDRANPVSGAQAIERAIALLEAMADAPPQGARLKDLAEQVGITQPTAARMLKALVANGFVRHDPGSRGYALGLRLFSLAAAASRHSGLKRQARPWLLRLAHETRANVFLMLREGADAVCTDRVDAGVVVHTVTGMIGGRVPLGIGPGSLAILAFLDHQEAATLIDINAAAFARYKGFDAKRVRDGLQAVRDQGYAFDRGDLVPGVRGMAVPIRCRWAGTVGALSLGALSESMPDGRLPILASRLAEAAAAIGTDLNPLDPALSRPDSYHLADDLVGY